jgi:GT2 family glycosyltransferase
MMSGRDWSDYQFEPLCTTSIYIEANRNGAVKLLLDGDSDYLFFWDYDNGLLPDAFDIYMEDMEDPEVKIVSGNYFRKESSGRAVHGVMHPAYPDGFMTEAYMFLSNGLINLTKFPGFVGGMVGTGCLMIKREVFEETLDIFPWFETSNYYMKSKGKYVFSSEDVGFSEKIQKAGYDLYLDTRIQSPHYAGHLCYPGEWGQEGLDILKYDSAKHGKAKVHEYGEA